MNLEFRCPFCTRELSIDERLKNQETKCPSCGNSLVPAKLIAKNKEAEEAKKKEEELLRREQKKSQKPKREEEQMKSPQVPFQERKLPWEVMRFVCMALFLVSVFVFPLVLHFVNSTKVRNDPEYKRGYSVGKVMGYKDANSPLPYRKHASHFSVPFFIDMDVIHSELWIKGYKDGYDYGWYEGRKPYR